ncbi:MAG: TadE/TadG family type IV pilus assembly protein, partial [Chloroflexota bacterium]
MQKLVQILDGTPAEYGERENGQSVVELALVMPILLILLVGMIEIGWFTNNYLILLEASRVGSREGTKLGGDSSPYTWEQGTITLQVDDPTTEDVDEGRDLNSIVGVAAPAFLSEQRDTFTGGPEVRSPNAAPLAADPPVDDAQRVEGALARGAGTPDELACERLRIGFYTNVACATLDSMAPLDQSVTFIPNDELTFPGENDLPLPLNDIIVSVFSINRIPALVGGSPSIEEQRANQFAGPFRTVTQTGVANHNSIHGGTLSEIDYTGVPGQAPRDAGNNPNPAAAQVMVTGRFPANANECESDWRDPFDLDNNGAFNAWEIDDERLNILNNGGILMDSVDEDFYNITGVGNSPEALRGFALTGKWRAANSENCMGSEWDIIRMERLVNLRTGEPTEQEVLELP